MTANDQTPWETEEPVGEGKINSIEVRWSKNPRRGGKQRTRRWQLQRVVPVRRVPVRRVGGAGRVKVAGAEGARRHPRRHQHRNPRRRPARAVRRVNGVR